MAPPTQPKPAISVAQTPDDKFATSWYVHGFVGPSAIILGSQDPRFGYGLSVGYGRPDAHFRFRKIPAQFVLEGYWDTSESKGVNGIPSNRTEAVGALAISRYRWPADKQGNGYYAEIGWGLQYATRPTVDLDSKLNSTPILGIGGLFHYTESSDIMLGLRLLHISNAGTKKPNHGQNQVLLVAGFRFK